MTELASSEQGPLTLETLAILRGPEGESYLQRARSLLADPFAVEKLRREMPADVAAAAIEVLRLRRRAAHRFPWAERLWATGPLLEQASAWPVATYRAARLAAHGGDDLLDLCCGLGADSLALAAYAPVTSCDRSPLSLALTAANARAMAPRYPVTPRLTSLPEEAPAAPCAWIDPGRRESGRRTRHLDAASPPLEQILTLLPRIPALGVKLSPATPDAELTEVMLSAGVPWRQELISVGGECRELVLWLGRLGEGPPRRATQLHPDGRVLAELEGEPLPLPPPAPAGQWLLEPDSAIIRAGLVGNLASHLQAWPIDARLAYLCLSEALPTPAGRLYRIEAPQPFSRRALERELRARRAGDVVLKTRGFALDPATLRRELAGVLKQGDEGLAPVVFLTRLDGRPVMIVGERIGAGNPQP